MANVTQAPALSRLNSFRAALAAKQRQIGFWLVTSDPCLMEVSATAGFGWLSIDSEHIPNGVRTVPAQLQAVAPYRVEPVVQPYSGDPVLIKRLLDIDACMLLVSTVDAAEQAYSLARVVRYLPFGIRSVDSAADRAPRWSVRTDCL